ncbi:DUF421 domain-containing protein [Cupriavidus sp. TA19]|uniref:DUF421 domain-containing protein n=1 Tax=unclassified Cupriavidus TaxID=2640874 RepID=UPI000E2F2B53|nr:MULTISPECIES: YetF domain-containing protein [unclassified Cupriavidus]BDB27654.1 DUF421 domain-containing protein [Cupriavidus sp. P-10]GLC92989.1 DUF421 domain-containing protein [Cupriavidus sp. TA19]
MDIVEILADLMRNAVGEGDDLLWWQGAVRAAIVFVGTWAMLRLAGRRAFAQKSSFDLCIVLLLGAVLARVVVGATSFAVAFAAAFVLVLLHRAVGWLSGRYPAFDRLTGGHALDLLSQGELDSGRVRRAMLTEEDLQANLRATLQTDSFADLTRVVLERDGKVTFVRQPRDDEPAKQSPAAATPTVSRGNGVPVRPRSARQ